MTKDEFLQRFQLRSLPKSCHDFSYPATLKQAAVLLPIVEHQQQLNIILTKRAEHLYHHPGQISFPGGKVEPTDTNLAATALRETQEEIGLATSAVDIIGQLSPYHTISGYHITPIVAFIEADAQLNIDHNEVAEVFQVPLIHFLKPKNHLQLTTHFRGQDHQVHFMPYQHYNIWGATAAILKDLSQLLR